MVFQYILSVNSADIDHLDKTIVEQTLGVFLKDWRDTREVQLSLEDLLKKTGVHSRIESL